MTHKEAVIEMFEDLYAEEGFLVSYTRGVAAVSGVRVVKAQQRDERFGSIEPAIYLTDRGSDFIVVAEEFRNQTALPEPERLDRIEFEGSTYRVGVDGVEDVYRDPHGLDALWRIHTQKVD